MVDPAHGRGARKKGNAGAPPDLHRPRSPFTLLPGPPRPATRGVAAGDEVPRMPYGRSEKEDATVL